MLIFKLIPQPNRLEENKSTMISEFHPEFENGFTLIELLVTVAIVGILASMAIPMFEEYRSRAYDASSASDLINMRTSQEAYFINNSRYLSCDGASTCKAGLPGFSGFSPSVGGHSTGSTTGFAIETCSSKGSRGPAGGSAGVPVKGQLYYSSGYLPSSPDLIREQMITIFYDADTCRTLAES